MHLESYKSKLRDITSLEQFERVIPKRKNEKHSVLKEEEFVVSVLKGMLKKNKINEDFFDKVKPSGSQAPRLYGLAKVLIDKTPLRPVVSMPGSPYHIVANQVSEWLKVVKECNINASTKSVVETISNIKLSPEAEIYSFDVVSLYTNVPVREAIEVCVQKCYTQELINSQLSEKKPSSNSQNCIHVM